MSRSHPSHRTTSPFLSASMGQSRRRVSLEPDTMLGPFRIQRHLGSGSLGDVYLAENRVTGRDAAIKVVDVGPCSPDLLARQLRREKAVYDRIQDHRHVLKVHDIHAVAWGGTELLVLSMAYADGGTFRTWLQDHRDNWETRKAEGLAYFAQIARGTAACHEVGVTHLDLKPENCVFVAGVLKVSDFNVSAFVQHLTIGCTSLSGLDAGDVYFGTPAYMSPEHFSAPHPDDLDARADIYSLGIMFYEILHPQCRPPFGGSASRLRELHLHQDPPALPGASEAEARVVARCLQKDREERYASVNELLDDLEGRASATPGPQDSEMETEDDVEGMRAAIHESIGRGRLGEARRLCEELLEACPGHREARDILDHLHERQAQSGRLYAEVAQGLNGRALDELGPLLLEAVRTYPDHPEGRPIHIQFQIKAQQYRERIEEGMAALRSRDPKAARSWFERAQQLNPGSPGAERPLRFVAAVLEQIEEVRGWIDQAIAAGNQRRALALARGIDDFLDRMAESVSPSEGAPTA